MIRDSEAGRLLHPHLEGRRRRFAFRTQRLPARLNVLGGNWGQMDGGAVHRRGSSCKVFLTTTGRTQVGSLQFDRAVIRDGLDPFTCTASSPTRLLNPVSLFRGKQAGLGVCPCEEDAVSEKAVSPSPAARVARGTRCLPML